MGSDRNGNKCYNKQSTSFRVLKPSQMKSSAPGIPQYSDGSTWYFRVYFSRVPSPLLLTLGAIFASRTKILMFENSNYLIHKIQHLHKIYSFSNT